MIMRLPRLLACVTIAAAAIAALIRPSRSASATVQPVRSEEPTSTDSGHDHVRCEALRDRILDRATDPVGSTSSEEQESLLRDVRTASAVAGASDGETCMGTVLGEMAKLSRCGSAAELAASAAAEAGALMPDLLRSLSGSGSSCELAIVSGAAHVPHPENGVLDAIRQWSLRQREPPLRSGGLIVFGSLVHLMRDADDNGQVVGAAERLLVEAIRKPTHSVVERGQLLEAAGNAGCATCIPEVVRALRASSANVRYAAAGALRFVPDVRAATVMCRTLLDDDDPDVREQAAWALKWDATGVRERVACLTTSAARDSRKRVRHEAALSLVALAKSSGLARSALLHLTSDEYEADVREIAGRYFDSDDSEVVVDGASVSRQ